MIPEDQQPSCYIAILIQTNQLHIVPDDYLSLDAINSPLSIHIIDVWIDLTSVFDKVLVDGFLEKMVRDGAEGRILRYIKTYLYNI